MENICVHGEAYGITYGCQWIKDIWLSMDKGKTVYYVNFRSFKQSKVKKKDKQNYKSPWPKLNLTYLVPEKDSSQLKH